MINAYFKNDPFLIDIVAKRAATVFEETYPNLLACFDVESVFSAIASVFRLDGGPTGDAFNVPNVVIATEEAFKKLLMRGALNEFQRVPPPIPEAAQRELDKLFGEDEIDPVIEAREAHAAEISTRQVLINEAAKDWRSMGTREYRSKWMMSPERQAIAEAAWSMLEAQDKSVADGFKSQRDAREREANLAIHNTPLSPRDF
jgi:hypothetical protein